MSEFENHADDMKRGLGIKDWVLIGVVFIAFLFIIGFFKGSASNFKLKTENERLRNDIRYLSVLTSTLVDMKEKEKTLNQWECEERLNHEYLKLYDKLNLKSESIRIFKSKIDEALIEKAGMVEQRNEKAASYNEYAKSFDWETYKDDLYNIPSMIEKIE